MEVSKNGGNPKISHFNRIIPVIRHLFVLKPHRDD